MCGIYVSNLDLSEHLVRGKLTSISFRGPDNHSVKKKGNIMLGHVRLSIIDLDERSNQPYSYGKLHMVFNGEIYNFTEIKQELISHGFSFNTSSDSEVLLKGFSFWGKKILPRLNGMFAFVIYDEENKDIFCARDRLGVKPFYYYWKDGKFEICSQLRPLNKKSNIVSKEAISIYLDCGYIPSPLTIFEDIYKLSPGHILHIDLAKGIRRIEQYWDLKPVETTHLSYDDAKNKLHQLLIDSVKLRMQTDVPLGSFLSGGIDSALVSAIAAKYSDGKLNTFTIGFDNPEYDESRVAKQYAEVIETNHKETICNPEQVLKMLVDFKKVYDEPFADSSALPSLLLNKITKENVTVALSGDGGDESFIGYWHLMLVDKFKWVGWIPYRIRKLLSKFPFHIFLRTRPETIRGILSSKDENDLISKIFTSFDSLNKKRDYSWINKYYPQFRNFSTEPLQRAADLNIKLWLENDSNVKVDRASMAFSVESRSPFLDFRVIEFARTLPISYRFKDGVTKRIIRDILKEYIPEDIFTQPKKGFAIPLGHWIRTDLKNDILAKLNDSFLQSIPNLNVSKFKKQLDEHLRNKYDYSFSIWKLYVLALWCEEFNISLIEDVDY